MLPVDHIQRKLSFPALDDCIKFLKEKGAVFTNDETKIDCKASVSAVCAS